MAYHIKTGFKGIKIKYSIFVVLSSEMILEKNWLYLSISAIITNKFKHLTQYYSDTGKISTNNDMINIP